MPDTYLETGVTQQNDPAIGAVAINYAGGNQTVSGNSRAVYISTAGNLAVIMANGTVATFTGLLAGQIYPIKVIQVTQTGSSAAGLLLY